MRKSLYNILFLTLLTYYSSKTFAQNTPIQSSTKIELTSSVGFENQITFKIEQFSKRQVSTPQGPAFIIETEKGTPMLVAGAPDLEKLSASVIIPDNAEMELEIISSNFTDYKNILIAPSKGNITRDKDPKSIAYKFGDAYKKDAFYPSQIAELRDPYILRDYRGQTVMVYPFQYNPISKTLRVYNEISVKIKVKNTNNGKNILTAKAKSKSSEFNKIYASHFLNHNKINRYQSVEESGNMLIICYDTFLDAMQPFVQWKKQKGIPTEIVGINSIGNNVTSIQNFITNYYNNNGLTYLLFVGDAAQIATKYFASSGHSDNAYAYISGADAYPEFFVGRFSAENTQHVKTQVNRTIQYEKFPSEAASWYKQGIGIASDEGPGDDNEYDYQHQRNIRTQLMNYGYANISELYDGNHGGEDAAGNPNPSDFKALVESGVGIINYTGHGSNQSLVTTNFSNSDVNALNNNGKWPFIWSVACVNGEFVDYTCFAETWLRATDINNNPTGAIATLMSTINQSWAPPMDAQDEFNAILTESYNNNIKRSFGGISMNGCMKMNDSYGQEGAQMTDTWTLFGDPSLSVRTNTPFSLNVTHQPSVYIGSTALQINCDIENAFICLTINGEIIGTGTISGGTTSINYNSLTTTDTILLTATSYNAIPYIGNVLVVPASGPYIYSSGRTINDSNGNNNGKADYSETIALDITLKNTGIENSQDVNAVLSSLNSYVNIINNTQNFGDINSGASILKSEAYTITITNDVPDQHIVNFNLAISDNNNNNWNSPFNIIINAPKLTSSNLIIDDSNGNNNGRLDLGETVNIIIPVKNIGHSKSQAISCSLNTISQFITINNTSYQINPLNESLTENAIFNVTVSSSTPPATPVSFVFAATAGAYSTTKSFNQTIDISVEDFESNDFGMHSWNNNGSNLSWFTTSESPYEGAYCSRSGAVTDEGMSIMEISLNIAANDTISFYKKVSSESNYDFLKFYIDNDLIEEWSGNENWTRHAYPVEQGQHTFRWVYEKDYMVSEGSDCAWLDYIIFPQQISVTGIEQYVSSSATTIYPNPMNLNAVFTYELKEISHIEATIYNNLGEVVLNLIEIQKQNPGNHTVEINGNDLQSGIYYIKFKTGDQILTKKIVVSK